MAHPVLAVTTAVLLSIAAGALAMAAVRLARAARRAGREAGRSRVAAAGLLVPAALALGMSADTSYRYLGAELDITNELERALLCGVAEAAIVALTVYAWATRTKAPAYVAYAAVLVQAIPAFQVSGGTGGPVRVILGPVLLAVMLHLLLGLELRMSGGKTDGILADTLREARERLTAHLGIGRRGADSAAIARSRAADRAVSLADKLSTAQPGTRKHVRRAAKLAAAIDAARHNLTNSEADAAEASIVARVVRRKSVTGLATITARHDWSALLEGPAEVPAEVTAEVPAPVAEVPAEVPTLLVPATAPKTPQVPAESTETPTPLILAAEIPAPVGASAEVSPLIKAGSAEVPADVPAPVRGAATRAARELIQGGTTEIGAIREDLETRGIKPPSDRYLRQLVAEGRNNRGTGAYL
ncbi:hypothetical protein [Streptomyces sp. NPDC012450]|uniref:hypothetical protein n=1 Tax=Streptomyces sp. NPDC012450 TaxID=3364834 RepID=UPI0036E12F6F